MLNDLTSEQRKLADFMSGLSERCYSSGWLRNLEYVLWDTISNGERKYGHDKILQHDIEELRQLSADCNCWIYFDDVKEETNVDLASWTQKFNETTLQNPNVLKG